MSENNANGDYKYWYRIISLLPFFPNDISATNPRQPTKYIECKCLLGKKLCHENIYYSAFLQICINMYLDRMREQHLTAFSTNYLWFMHYL